MKEAVRPNRKRCSNCSGAEAQGWVGGAVSYNYVAEAKTEWFWRWSY